jgi:hypothetical protein
MLYYSNVHISSIIYYELFKREVIRMKLVKILSILILVLACAFVSFACSNDKSPVNPSTDDAFGITNDLPESSNVDVHSRSLLAAYDAVIDPVAKTFTVTPINRSAQYHFPLSQLYPNVLQITGYGWTPNFWADIKLVHPLPDSGIDGFDPRVIAILPANPGVSFNYPTFNVTANNSVVLEPDGYTKLFDGLGGIIPGNTNPFKAYFKDQPNRIWSSTGTTEETQRWQMDIAGFGGPLVYQLVVDVSTNYPDPPQPVIDNALEPVPLSFEISEGLTTSGGEATVTATFLDWQGPSEIKCKVESLDLFDGAVQLFYSEPGPNPNEYVFKGTISNDLGAGHGNYDVLLATWDINVGHHIFLETTVSVDRDFDLRDVTPGWLHFTPNSVFVDGNYAYATGGSFTVSGVSGLHIFDITNPINPVWVNKIITPHNAKDVYVSDGYAYVADGWGGLQIIDIDPVDSASIVHNVGNAIDGYSQGVFVSGDYAYVADDEAGFMIINITEPEAAYIVGYPGDMGYYESVFVSGDYAFLTTARWDGGVSVYDIDPPEDAHFVKNIPTPGHAVGVDGKENLLYVADEDSVLIIDPVSSEIIRDIDTPGSPDNDVFISGEFAYVAGGDGGLHIIDITEPEMAEIIRTVDTFFEAQHIHVLSGYAYATDSKRGLQVIDVEPPESAYLEKTFGTLSQAKDIYVSENHAYVVSSHFEDWAGELQIIDVSIPELSYIVNSVDTLGGSYGVFTEDDYAYVTVSHTWTPDVDGLKIFNIADPESAYIEKTVNNVWGGSEVYVSDGYAYVAAGLYGFVIIDIDPLISAQKVKTLDINQPFDVQVSDSFAYVGGVEGLSIINIADPESAYIVDTVETSDTVKGIHLVSGYAYVAVGGAGLQIIDISDSLSAHIVNTVDTPGKADGVYVENGYAYVADYWSWSGLQIIDVDPPESAHIVDEFILPHAIKVHVYDGYAYVANDDNGLRIIDLY